MFKRCKHDNTRCVHGDEINVSSKGFFRIVFARRFCLDCERYLYDTDLPLICTETKLAHDTHEWKN